MNKKIFVALVAIPLLIGLFFFENIKGYYRFKWYCKNEGGLKVYEQLEKNAAWISEGKSEAMFIAQQDHMGFSLYRNKDGNLVNVIYKDGNPSSIKSYDFVQYDGEKDPRYEYKRSHGRFNRDTEIRLYKANYIVIDRKSGKPSVQVLNFAYSFFDKNNIPLAPPGGRSGCIKWPWVHLAAAINSNFKG